MPVRYVTVDDEEGQRVDNFLIRELSGVPRSRVYRLLRRGEVRVDRGRVGPDYRLKRGDLVRLPPHENTTSARPPPAPPPSRARASARPRHERLSRHRKGAGGARGVAWRIP